MSGILGWILIGWSVWSVLYFVNLFFKVTERILMPKEGPKEKEGEFHIHYHIHEREEISFHKDNKRSYNRKNLN